MAWRGSTDAKDRFFSAIVYLIPLHYAQSFFGASLGFQLPALRPLLDLIALICTPVNIIYSLIPLGLGSLVIFFVLYLAVVRNETIKHFIRFNTLQAILLDIALFLLALIAPIIAIGFVGQVFNTIVFLASLMACGYAIAQSALGRYAEMPTISDAAYSQLR
ncbi:MAG: hypothetical protein Tsb0014_07540 [Pleurocapsa sp.]